MYKTQYKSALKTAGITYEDLSAKNKAAYDNMANVESSYISLKKELDNAEDDDKESVQESIDELGKEVEKLDKDLCWKISKNEFYKQQALKLTNGRLAANAKKAVAASTPPVKPVENKPEVKEEKPEATPEVKVEVTTGTQDAPAGVTVEVKPTPAAGGAAPAKKENKATVKKEGDKDEKPTAGKVGLWILGGVGAAAFALWGIPMPALNKKAFSFKFTWKK